MFRKKDAVFLSRTHRTGDILGLLAEEDINHIQNLYLRTIFPTVIAWLLYTFLIIGLGYFSLGFALVMLLLLGIKCVCAAALVRCDQWRSSRKAKTNEESIIYNID